MERFLEKEDVGDKFTKEKMNENFYKLPKLIAFAGSPKYVLLSCKVNFLQLLHFKVRAVKSFNQKDNTRQPYLCFFILPLHLHWNKYPEDEVSETLARSVAAPSLSKTIR